MANKDYYYYGSSNLGPQDKPLPSAPSESIYSERPGDLSHSNSQHRPASPINSYDADPYASHPTLTSHQQRYTPTPLHRNDSDPFSSHDTIPLQHQVPKANTEHSQYPPREHRLQRQESDSYLIQAEEQQPSRSGRKRGRFDWSRIPWVCYTVTIIQLCVFIAELVKMSSLTGSPIVKPSQNPMIGPSNNLLINMGARYVACMRNQVGIQDVKATAFFCPNSTDVTSDQQLCSLQELCGFESTNPVPNPNTSLDPQAALNTSPAPNQWFRFIIPIFMHGGFIHIASNLLLQLMIARDMEKVIGSIRFALVYFSAGIFGFVFGGNYAASGIAST